MKINKITIEIGILIILFIILFFIGRNFFINRNGISSINNQISTVDIESKKEIDRLNSIIKEKEKEYNLLEKRYLSLSKEILNIKEEINNIKPPVTNKEIRSRFEKLGYNPI